MRLSEKELKEILRPKGVWGWFTRHPKVYWVWRIITWNFFEVREPQLYSRHPRWLVKLFRIKTNY